MNMSYRQLVVELGRRRRIFGGYVLAKFGNKWPKEKIRRRNRSKILKKMLENFKKFVDFIYIYIINRTGAG